MHVCVVVFIIYCVLFTLKNNLFEWSHSIIVFSSLFIISVEEATLFPAKNKFESSAHEIVNDIGKTFTISFM